VYGGESAPPARQSFPLVHFADVGDLAGNIPGETYVAFWAQGDLHPFGGFRIEAGVLVRSRSTKNAKSHRSWSRRHPAPLHRPSTEAGLSRIGAMILD
jgi:hypothetical protein